MMREWEALENMKKRAMDKAKGYDSKCKTCTHGKKDEIERLHELGYTNRDIMNELDLWESMSEQALGRHLNKHYPLSKKYHIKQELLKEKLLQEAFEYNDALKSFILDNDDETTHDFLYRMGYCYTGNCLCDIIKKGKCLDGYEVLEALKTQYYNIKYDESFGKDHVIIGVMDKLNKCYSCQLLQINSDHQTLLRVLTKELFKLDNIEEYELKNIIQDNDYDPDCIINDLYKFNEKEDNLK